MSVIYTIGETLLDIFFRNGEVIGSRPGGAMLNTAVSLGRVQAPVSLVSEYGRDQAGRLIDGFLRDNGVGLDHVYRFEEGQTAVAMAFLDEDGEASYDFYKQYPRQRLQIDTPDFRAGDIILFGSFYALLPEIRERIKPILHKAREKGCIIIYDPNIRNPHKKDVESLRDAISENISMANIIRGSNEDFLNIFNIKNQDEVFKVIQKPENQLLIYTMNKHGVHLVCRNQSHFYKVPEIRTVSTVGAGDSFNAGIIYAIWSKELKPADIIDLPLEIWNENIETGINFASIVCQSMDNYISSSYARKIRGLVG
jgi:fructokinase